MVRTRRLTPKAGQTRDAVTYLHGDAGDPCVAQHTADLAA
jgi:hypothetical protein